MLKVKVPITFPRDCKRRHPIFKDISNDRQLCAGGEEGKYIYHIINYLYYFFEKSSQMKQLINLPIVYYILLGKDSCNGDSGGPLMSYNGDFKGTKYLRGIVSFGTTTCGNVRKQNIIYFHKSILQK